MHWYPVRKKVTFTSTVLTWNVSPSLWSICKPDFWKNLKSLLLIISVCLPAVFFPAFVGALVHFVTCYSHQLLSRGIARNHRRDCVLCHPCPTLKKHCSITVSVVKKGSCESGLEDTWLTATCLLEKMYLLAMNSFYCISNTVFYKEGMSMTKNWTVKVELTAWDVTSLL